jgi:hypothetical protein
MGNPNRCSNLTKWEFLIHTIAVNLLISVLSFVGKRLREKTCRPIYKSCLMSVMVNMHRKERLRESGGSLTRKPELQSSSVKHLSRF